MPSHVPHALPICFTRDRQTLTNNIAINTIVYVLLWTYVRISLAHISRSYIVGMLNVCILNLTKFCKIAYQNGCTNLYLH